MGKTEDLLKKTGDIKGTFHAKMGTTKDRNAKDLTEREEIDQSWQEYAEKLYKTGPSEPDSHNGVVTHLARARHPGCEVKWALESITMNKASGGDKSLAELFKILRGFC